LLLEIAKATIWAIEMNWVPELFYHVLPGPKTERGWGGQFLAKTAD
jgi:hypothetical protein